MIKKSIKYLSYLVATLFVVVILFMLFTQTSWFDRIVKKQAVNLINKELNAIVSIDGFNSNYYNYLDLTGVKLRQKVDSSLITQVDLINLQFNLWSIFEKKIEISSVIINNLDGSFEQDENGRWEIADIIPTSGDTTTATSPFSYAIQIDTIRLNNWNIASNSTIELVPDSIQNLNLFASFYYKQELMDFKLHNLELVSINPDLTIRKLNGHFNQDGSLISIDSLIVETSRSLFETTGKYQSINNSAAQLKADPISKDEFKIFVPSVQLPASPKVDLDYLTRNDTSYFNVDLTVYEEEIHLKAQILNLDDYSNKKINQIPFSAEISFVNMHPENWWLMSNTNSTLQGSINIKGNHLLDYTTWINIKGDLTGSTYLDHHFKIFKFNAQQNNFNVSSSLIAQSYLGKAEGNIELHNYSSNPTYKAHLKIDSLLLNKIISDDAGLANGRISVIGKGLSTDSIDAYSTINISQSNIYGVPVDSAYIKANLKNNLLKISESRIRVPGGKVNASGNFQLSSKELDGKADFIVDSLTFLQHFLKPEFNFTQATGQFAFNGSIDSLNTEGYLTVSKFKGYSLSSNKMNARLNVNYVENHMQAKTSFQIQALQNKDILADTIYGNANYKLDTLFAEVFAKKDSINTNLKTHIHLADTLGINIDNLRFNTPRIHYYTTDTINLVEYYNHEFTIKDLALKDELSPQFSLKAKGTFGANRTQNLEFMVDNFDLNSLTRLHILDDYIDGLFSINMRLTGQPQSPELKSTFNVKNGQFDQIQLPFFEGNLTLKKDTLKSSFINPENKNEFNLSFTTPFETRFDTTGFIFNMSDQFEAILRLDSFDIAAPTEKLAQLEVEGMLNANIRAKGEFSKPLLYGKFNLQNGKYSHPVYGIDMSNAQIALNFDSNKVAIDTFIIKRDKGYLTMTGAAVFDSSLVSGSIHSSTLEANANNFYVIKHRDYSALIDAKTFFTNSESESRFGGKIKVLRSEFYLPAFMDSEDENKEQNVPLLVQATEVSDTLPGSKQHISLRKKKEETSPFITNLQGRLELEIPRNTWLRSEDMSIEIWGDLEIEKSNPYFELFGELGINRGHYILYGKKLVINEGTLTFQGGQEIDPILNFNASYTYRGPDKEKRKLELSVSEKLSEPAISFKLDDASITEGDAISILIFGKTMDELSYSGQNGISGAIGTNMLTKAVTSQLSKTLGTQFNLDMIEVTAAENWQSAAFVVGKYVTNDLFVIYQRGFGETDGDEITPEIIILEYELSKNLFMRLQSGSSKESGFDVILKFESKKD
nr:translocation/assembly module TamB domain-containing protein [uncultured Carboxylicivirga sp.]